ncbi:MAG: element excision factor XisH family protein [Limnothrix sp.]
MAKDLFHNAVKNALIKEGWQITDDPLYLKVGGVEFYVDLGAEKLIAAERGSEKIAIEIKSFVGTSQMTDFHLALGQFLNYRVALKVKEPDRKLFLAIPDTAYKTLFQKEFAHMVIAEYKPEILVYDTEKEVIIRWKI